MGVDLLAVFCHPPTQGRTWGMLKYKFLRAPINYLLQSGTSEVGGCGATIFLFSEKERAGVLMLAPLPPSIFGDCKVVYFGIIPHGAGSVLSSPRKAL